MTKDDAQACYDSKTPVWTRVSGRKVQVVITKKVESGGARFGSRKKTEWAVQRVDNGRELSPRNAGALHKNRDFMAD